MSPPCARAISRAIARPRPVPPLERSLASSSRTNRSKTRACSGSGMPGPSSSTVSRACPSLAASARSMRPRAWARGVVAEVAHEPREIAIVPGDPCRRHRVRVDGQRRCVPQPNGLREHHVVEIHLGVRQPQGALVEPREQEQIVHDRLQPDALLGHRRRELAHVGRRRMRAGDLRVLTDRSDRRTQLVRRVGDEPTLPIARRSHGREGHAGDPPGHERRDEEHRGHTDPERVRDGAIARRRRRPGCGRRRRFAAPRSAWSPGASP